MAKASTLEKTAHIHDKQSSAMSEAAPKVWNSRRLEYVTPTIYRIDEILRLRKLGMTIAQIAKRFGCHYWTIWDQLDKYTKKRSRARNTARELSVRTRKPMESEITVKAEEAESLCPDALGIDFKTPRVRLSQIKQSWKKSTNKFKK